MSKDNLSTELLNAISNRKVTVIRNIFDEHNIVDLAEIVGEMTVDQAVFVFKVLRKDTSADLFSYLDQEKQEKLVELLTGVEIKSIINNLYADDAVEFMGELPDVLVKKILKSVSKEKREEINELLAYKENSCGSIMGTDFVELKYKDTISQAMEEVKNQRKVAESISYGYILKRDVLVGIITLRDIIFAPNDNLLADEMETDFAYCHTDDDQEIAIKLMKKYDLMMIPVVDDENKLVGIITADDVIDAMQEEATEDIHKLAAVNPMEGSYLSASPFKVAKSRLPWLLILMISAAISETIITKNNYLILAMPALSYFIPMLMDTAGNAGSQSSATIVRGIVAEGLTFKDAPVVIKKEFLVALVCGFALFVVNLIRILLTMRNVSLEVALISSITIFAVVIVAKFIGGVLPLLANSLHLDPAVMASPLIATACDAVSLTLYFTLAALFQSVII